METKNKGQAALDFMMTYGWALLIIFLVASAIFALNIFDLGSFVGNRASGFSQLGAAGWKVAGNGVFTLMLKNNAGTDVNITQVNATMDTATITYDGNSVALNGQNSPIISVGTFANPPSYGGSYSLKVNIAYVDSITGQTYIDSGMLYGKTS